MTTHQVTRGRLGKSHSRPSGYRPMGRGGGPASTQQLSAKHAAYFRHRDPRLGAELIERHAGLATSLALPFAGRGEDLDDLVQVARIGLVKALERYDPERGTTFATFATPTIRGELKRHFRDKAWAVRVPRRLQELYLTSRETSNLLRQELGRPPTMAEVASSLGEPPDEVAAALQAGQSYWALSLDAPLQQDRPEVAVQLDTDDGGMGQVEARIQVTRLLERLTEQERRVVGLRFFEDLTQAEIAARVGVSQMAVSKTLARALRRLRDAA